MTFPIQKPELIDILLIEDTPADIRLVQIALQRAKILNDLNTVNDGEQALQYLHLDPPYEEAKRPDLILLDLNLPKIDGRDVLEHIKHDEDLRQIPVVVLTTSGDDFDVERAYRAYANAYITKPVEFNDFIEAIKRIEDFWLSIVRYPNRR